MEKLNHLERVTEHTFLNGKVFKEKTINVKRVRGVGAFALSWSIYAYLPYIAAFTGPTLPVLSAVAAGLYGAFSFVEGYQIKSIEVVKEGEHAGKLLIKVGTSPLSSKSIIVQMKDIYEISSLDEDDIGYSDDDATHLVMIKSHIDQATGEHVQEGSIVSLSSAGHKDKEYLDWILTNKE